MKISEIIWLDTVVEKLEKKHGVSIFEVEYILKGKPYCRFINKGNVAGDDIYAAFGRTAAGMYLIVFFIYKKIGKVIPVSARPMDRSERKMYGRS